MATLNLTYNTEQVLQKSDCDAPAWFKTDVESLDLEVYVYTEIGDYSSCDRIYVGNTGMELHVFDLSDEESIPSLHYRPNCYSTYHIPEDQKVQNVYLFAAAVESLLAWYQSKGKVTHKGLNKVRIYTHPYLIRDMQRLFGQYENVFTTEMPDEYFDNICGEVAGKKVEYYDSYLYLEPFAEQFSPNMRTFLTMFSDRVKRKVLNKEELLLINPRLSRKSDNMEFELF